MKKLLKLNPEYLFGISIIIMPIGGVFLIYQATLDLVLLYLAAQLEF
tara:strand:- start:2700 stop:2840 length:141 start_codon:yes stop_codon:yes gene_type:complete